jgi:hypothetical protein
MGIVCGIKPGIGNRRGLSLCDYGDMGETAPRMGFPEGGEKGENNILKY